MRFSGAPLNGPTLCGLGAILLWGLLALLTAATAGVPPFLLTALTFAIAGLARLRLASRHAANSI